MTNRRVLKKYPNRRLYDTAHSRYITLRDAGSLLNAGQEIQVLDSRTGEDITRSVLLQILVELEHGECSLLSSGLLARLIPLHQVAGRMNIAQILEEAVDRLIRRDAENDPAASANRAAQIRPNPHSGFFQPAGRPKPVDGKQ